MVIYIKIAKKFLTNIFVSVLLIYNINIFLNNLGFIVPINIFSIFLIGILGIPGLFIYIVLSIFYM